MVTKLFANKAFQENSIKIPSRNSRLKKKIVAQATVKVLRKDKIKLKKGESVKKMGIVLRNKAGKAELNTKESVDVAEVMGGKLINADQKVCAKIDIKGGVQVASIKSNGLLSRARVRQGFIITHINDKRILSITDIDSMLESVKSIDGIYPDGRSASYVFVE